MPSKYSLNIRSTAHLTSPHFLSESCSACFTGNLGVGANLDVEIKRWDDILAHVHHTCSRYKLSCKVENRVEIQSA